MLNSAMGDRAVADLALGEDCIRLANTASPRE
jgi:hypothetical protein